MGINDYYLDQFDSNGEPCPGSSLTLFDKAIGDYIRDKGGEILLPDNTIFNPQIVFATPERAFSIVTSPVEDYNLQAEPGAQSLSDRITLPIISYHRTGMERNENRHLNPSLMWTKRFSPNNNKVSMSPKPNPVDILYDVSFWTKYEVEKLMFLETLIQDFQPLGYLLCDFAHTQVPMRLENITDNSNLEDLGDGDRLLRVTFSIRVEGFIFRKPTCVPTIKGRCEITDVNDNVISEIGIIGEDD